MQCKLEEQHVKIMNSCVFMTIAYQTSLYLEGQQSDPYKLVLDLRTPWSWVKGPGCQQFSRNGTLSIGSNCMFDSKSAETQKEKFVKTYDCQGNCKPIPNRCAEIDLVQEGLSLFGSFISTKVYLSDRRYKKKPIKGFKMIQAIGLSGQSFLQGDGVLGLGQQHHGSNDLIYTDEQYSDDDEEDRQPNNESDYKMGFSESGTDLWSSIERSYGGINPRVFALYLGDHIRLTPQLLIGEKVVNYTEYMHKPSEFPLQWVKLPQLKYDSNEELSREYFRWNIPLKQILFRYNHLKRAKQGKRNDDNTDSQDFEVFGFANQTDIHFDKDTTAELSLQTSALVLPTEMLEKIIDKINSIYNIQCHRSKRFLKYVECSGLKDRLDVSELAISIHVGYRSIQDEDIFLNVDPSDLLIGCKKNKQRTFDCFLNLQSSPDGNIILGDAAFRNSYLVFDTENKKIGFAHARSYFNDSSIWSKIKDAIEIIEDDTVFILKLIFIFLSIPLLQFAFVPTYIYIQKNWGKIINNTTKSLSYSGIRDTQDSFSDDNDNSTIAISQREQDLAAERQLQDLESVDNSDSI